MTFVDSAFPLFLAAALAAYWLIADNGTRKLVLIVASFGFYAFWSWQLCFLLAGVGVLAWAVGIWIRRLDQRRSRWLLAAAVAANLGLLGVFKYYGFFVEQLLEAARLVGVPINVRIVEITLPIGISFYVFHAISYIVDLRTGKLKSPRGFVDVMLYITFFPQLVSGPIVRGHHFFPQLDSAREWRDVPWRAITILFLVGYFKKVAIADNLATLADPIFAAPQAYDSFSQFIATVFFGIQIYCDFSGYTDMALAVSALFGYRLMANFDAPYLSGNISDFWRRWHISLSFWLRDYLYIPLGGSRRGAARGAVALMTTMVLGGLWHGPAWTFVIWGALHGIMLSLYRVSEPIRRPLNIPWVVAIAATQWWIFLAWIFFRAEDLARAMMILRGFLWPFNYSSQGLHWTYAVAPLLLYAVHILWRRINPVARAEAAPPWLVAGAAGLFMAAIILLRAPKPVPFIYFQF